MRAVVVAPGPEFSVMDVHRGWVKGLEQLGVDVAEFNLNDRLNVYSEMKVERNGEYVNVFDLDAAVTVAFEGLKSLLYETWPDVIVVINGSFTNDRLFSQLKRTRPHKLVMVHTESPYEDDRQVGIADLVHLNVVNDPINLDRYPDGSLYLPHAYDPDIHHNRGRADRWDFSFVGSGYPSRTGYLEAVDYSDARVAIAGNWPGLDDDSPLVPFLLGARDECTDNADTADIYRASAMSANLYRREANADDLVDGWAMGPREVELAACGTFFARDPRGEGDEIFPMLPKVTDPAELSDVIAWSMTHPSERQAAADAARAAIADRTFATNAAATLRALGV